MAKTVLLAKGALMPRSRKVNLEKVQASLGVICPKCGKVISPAELRRIDFERMECPLCGDRFVPGVGYRKAK